MSRVERKQAAAEGAKTSAVGNKWGQFKNWFGRQAKWKKGLMIAGATIVTLLLILVIVAYSLFNSLLGDIFTESPEDYDLSLKAVDGYYNILLLGVDSRDMDNLEGTRSDAIMVVSINEETNDVKILSVYRDTYLKIGDTSTYDKVTHACMYGGPEMTMKTLNQSLDLNISNYVVVNFKAVADLVDALGGIEVDVQDYEISELNKYTQYTANNIGRDEYQLVESAGLQTLDGCQAVSYSRIRKGVGDDFQRTERMRTVVSAAMDKMKGMSFGELKKLVKVVTPQVQTNLSRGNVLGLGIRLPQYNINGTEGWPHNVTTGLLHGVSYVFPADLYDNVVMLHQDFFGQTDYVPSDEVLTMSNTIISNIAEGKKPGNTDSDKDEDKDNDSKDEDLIDEEFSDLDEDITADDDADVEDNQTGEINDQNNQDTDIENEDIVGDNQEQITDGDAVIEGAQTGEDVGDEEADDTVSTEPEVEPETDVQAEAPVDGATDSESESTEE